uniref:CSON004557 protein n=1 Tax=Culicoides sonorensis TaxID=179676 RepID=A0A336MR17_CULSO
MSGEGRSNLFIRSTSEEENGRLSRTISLSSVQEEVPIASNNGAANTDDSSYSSLSVPSNSRSKKKARDPATIERSNLVNICKLVVKELLEQSLRFGRMLDSDHLPLQHFFIVLEHVLRHGLRPKKGLLGPKKELWDVLQSVEKHCPLAQDITDSVRNLPTVKTALGRARAWLRLAVMQKKLADYLQELVERRDTVLIEYYEPHALMMSDEIILIMGILVGLNVIDCNLCVKEEDLDSLQGVIDFSLYLRSSTRGSPDEEREQRNMAQTASGNMSAVLDQKNYIEELNRHLNATVANLQQKVEQLTTTNALMKEDLAIARNSVLALQAENAALRKAAGDPHSNNIPAQYENHHVVDKVDPEMAEALAEERRKRNELERELDLQNKIKLETDTAMKLLEKDIHEKQDTIVSLRRQLEDIKQINLDMYRKLQECEDELNQKGAMVARLQAKASQIGNILTSLEKKYDKELRQESLDTDNPDGPIKKSLSSGEQLGRSKHDHGPPHKKRYSMKIDPIPPFNPEKKKLAKTPEGTSTEEKSEIENSENESKEKAEGMRFILKAQN